MPVAGPRLLRRPPARSRWADPGPPVFNPPAGLWITIRDSLGNYASVDFTTYLVAYSLSIKYSVSPYAGVLKCQLDGPTSLLNMVKVEQDLTWSREGVQYAGRIRSIDPTDQVIAGLTTLDISCQDLTSVLDADLCAFAVSAPQVSPMRTVTETDTQRIQWLLNSFGKQGVAARHVRQNYATVPATDYTGKTLREAIKSVLAFSGADFYVDNARDLHAFIDEKRYAPFTLTETPNDSTSFAYSGLELPSESIDLANAVYAIPNPSHGGDPDALAELVEATPGIVLVAAPSGAVASFKPGIGPITRVGALGLLTRSLTASVTSAFGQATTAGNLLVAWVTSNGTDISTVAAGWIKAASSYGDGNTAVAAIFYKPNCGAGEAAPTFTSGGASEMWAQLAEFNGPLTAPLDEIGARATTTLPPGTRQSWSVPASPADQALGDLVVGAGAYWFNLAGADRADTATFVPRYNNGAAAVSAGNSGLTSTAYHASFSYAVIPNPLPVGYWYEDAASIALYGRREAALSAPDVTAKSDLDGLARAFLLNNAWPRQEGSFTCLQPGLEVGQRFTISSSLYSIQTIVDPLGNYSAIVQALTVSYPEQKAGRAQFDVEFGEPAVDLAKQLGDVVSKIPDAASRPTLGTLGRAEALGTQTGITAIVDLSGLSVTVVVATGRRIRIKASTNWASTVAGDIGRLQIIEGTDTVQLANFQVVNTVHRWPAVCEVELTPSAGSHTYKLQGGRVSGTGTFQMQADNTNPAFILIEDIGT